MTLGVVLMVVALTFWWFVPSSTSRRTRAGARRARPWSKRWWRERGIYAAGFFFAFLGLTRLWDMLGWWRGSLVALAVIVAMLPVALVVMAVAGRRRRPESRPSAP